MGGKCSKDYKKDYCPGDLTCGTGEIPVCWNAGNDKKGYCANQGMNSLYQLQKDFDNKPYAKSITACVTRLNAMDSCDSNKYTASLESDGSCSVNCESESGTSGYYGTVNRDCTWIIIVLLLIIYLNRRWKYT